MAHELAAHQQQSYAHTAIKPRMQDADLNHFADPAQGHSTIYQTDSKKMAPNYNSITNTGRQSVSTAVTGSN